jgi:hypothetical protein
MTTPRPDHSRKESTGLKLRRPIAGASFEFPIYNSKKAPLIRRIRKGADEVHSAISTANAERVDSANPETHGDLLLCRLSYYEIFFEVFSPCIIL